MLCIDADPRSCLYVKRRADLINALSITPLYLRNKFSESGLVIDYRDWQIPLGRRFRALKIWFVVRTYGLQGLKANIRNTIRLGELFASLVESRPDLFRIVTKPAFALTVFYVIPPASQSLPAQALQSNMAHEGSSNDFTPDADAQATLDSSSLTKDIYEKIFSRRDIFLTSTVVDNQYTIRVVSANAKADEKYLRRAFKIIVETSEMVLHERANKAKPS